MSKQYKPKKVKVPGLSRYKDETVVTVYSALGLYCGMLVWPTKHLDMLTKMNTDRRGNYFAFE